MKPTEPVTRQPPHRAQQPTTLGQNPLWTKIPTDVRMPPMIHSNLSSKLNSKYEVLPKSSRNLNVARVPILVRTSGDW